MFTGITQGLATVVAVDRKDNALRLALDLHDLAYDIKLGASVSVSGACLTVVGVLGSVVHFDVIGETLDKTTLGTLRVNDQVNIERSARLGDEIGGHLVSGHVTGTVIIQKIDTHSNNHILTLTVDPTWMPYLLPKGFVALDGCSLTIVDVGPNWFTVHLIPETLARTTFGKKVVGNKVNLEIDPQTRTIVDTVRQVLKGE